MRRAEQVNTCVVCSDKFHPWYNRLDQPTCGKVACRYESRKNKVKFKCAHCGDESERIPSELDHEKNYCSRNCMYAQQSIDRTGPSGMPWWKGGWIDDSGHRRIRIDGKTISEHVYIMEQLMGRKLYPYEVVHHDNEIPDDNNPKNLIVMPRSEHIKLHNLRRIAKGGFNGSGRKSSKPNLTSEEMQQKRLEIEAKYFK